MTATYVAATNQESLMRIALVALSLFVAPSFVFAHANDQRDTPGHEGTSKDGVHIKGTKEGGTVNEAKKPKPVDKTPAKQ
jgi:hypothetical protein